LNASVEYLVAALLVFLLVSVTASSFIPDILLRATYISESQLRIEAEKIADQLLLHPGDPADWGVNSTYPSEINVLGLALEGGGPYDLDINKLIRIYESSLSEISEKEQVNLESMARLLGIYGRYSLSIKLTPLLNVTVQNISGNIHEITVKTHDDLPVANAMTRAVRVTAYVNQENKTVTYIEEPVENVTDYNGKATVEFAQLPEENKLGSIIVIFVDFYGVKTVFSSINEEAVCGVIIGNEIYVGHVDDDFNPEEFKTRKGRPGDPGGGAIHLYPAALHVTPTTLEPTILSAGTLQPITPEGSANPYYKFELEGLEKKSVMAIFVVKSQGAYKLVVARRAYNSLNVGVPTLATSPVARGAHIRRIVNISGFLYYFDLTLWRVVEES